MSKQLRLKRATSVQSLPLPDCRARGWREEKRVSVGDPGSDRQNSALLLVTQDSGGGGRIEGEDIVPRLLFLHFMLLIYNFYPGALERCRGHGTASKSYDI
jgi:hypothetical protein